MNRKIETENTRTEKFDNEIEGRTHNIGFASAWGVVSMVGLFGFGVLLFVGDIILHNIIKNKTIVNIIGLVVSVIATLLLIYGGLFS